MKFPYEPHPTFPSPTVPSGVLMRPEVSLNVIGATGSTSVLAVVDAGSDDTLLPLSVGRSIGATLDPTHSWKVEGIGGANLPVILGEVTLELTDGHQTYRWPAKVGFVDFSNPAEEAFLLGHSGFLNFFRTTLDGYLHILEFEITPAFPGTVS